MDDGRRYHHGGNNGVVSSFVFEAGEFVMRIEGRSDAGCIVGLTFVTNTRISALTNPPTIKRSSNKVSLIRDIWSLWRLNG